jgi:hypothetical protein
VTEHRQRGFDGFNHVWTLMERPDRTREESAVLHEVHAAARRANAIVGEADAARRDEARANELGEQIEEADAREHHFEALERLPW